MDRRSFLRSTAVVGAAALARSEWLDARAARAQTAPAPFEYGVASGDPLAESVILWTRVSPADAGGVHGSGKPVSVRWEVATDEGFETVVQSGTVDAVAEHDHTVKVDVTGLSPGTHHWYRFVATGATSPVGRTATAPTDAVASTRFAVVSCANWEAGYFGAYRGVLEHGSRPGHDLDFVLHVGDYLYEYENGRYGPGTGDDPPRLHDPSVEMVTLDDYRRRHAQYKTDPDLRSLHHRWPFVTTWDDHETTDNAWWNGAENHDASEGDYQLRRQAAIRAYFEWMPVRDQPASGSDREVRRLYRSFAFGGLIDLFVLDLRQYRDEQAADVQEGFLSTDLATLAEEGRSITGPEQRQWLLDGLASSRSAWRLVANPVMITPLRFANTPDLPGGTADVFADAFGVRPRDGAPLNADDWSGYPHDQRAVLDLLAGTESGNPVKNVVFLTGDIHTSWACDVPVDQGSYPVTPSVAAELVCPSVTSQNIDEIATKRGFPAAGVGVGMPAVVAALQASNPQVKYFEGAGHGFCICDVTAERLHQDWYFVEDRLDPATAWAFETSWEVPDQACAVRASGEELDVRSAASSPQLTTTSAPPPVVGPATETGSLPATGGRGGLVAPGVLVAGASAAAIARRRLDDRSKETSRGDRRRDGQVRA